MLLFKTNDTSIVYVPEPTIFFPNTIYTQPCIYKHVQTLTNLYRSLFSKIPWKPILENLQCFSRREVWRNIYHPISNTIHFSPFYVYVCIRKQSQTHQNPSVIPVTRQHSCSQTVRHNIDRSSYIISMDPGVSTVVSRRKIEILGVFAADGTYANAARV